MFLECKQDGKTHWFIVSGVKRMWRSVMLAGLFLETARVVLEKGRRQLSLEDTSVVLVTLSLLNSNVSMSTPAGSRGRSEA